MEIDCRGLPPQKRVYLVTGKGLGDGPAELGEALMVTFLYTLTQMDTSQDTIVFMNSGVYLAATGSRAMDDLKSLEDRGTEILSCGTCLDYYGLRNDLGVGRVSNMHEISERLRERVIRL